MLYGVEFITETSYRAFFDVNRKQPGCPGLTNFMLKIHYEMC